jgi:hypothetical protein
MSLKNLIVQGEFIYLLGTADNDPDKIAKEVSKLHSAIKNYFQDIGFHDFSPSSFVYNYGNFLFRAMPPGLSVEPIKSGKIFKKTEEGPYFKRLSEITDSAPFHITVNTHLGNLENRHTLIIEVISEPAIIHKFRQLKVRPELNQDIIDLIIYENELFIKNFGKACYLNVQNPPTPLDSFYRTEVSEKLKEYGFAEISNLLEKGREDIEKGRSQDGLVDLRTALDNFFVKVIESKGQKPAKDIDKNIDKLKGLGYIDEYTHMLLQKLCYNGLHNTLSKVTHDRVPRDLFDSRFQFNVAEQIFDYVLERVIRLNLSYTPNNQSASQSSESTNINKGQLPK